MASYSTNLITAGNRVQVPFIIIKIGDYEFGNYNKDAQGFEKYPNYVQSLEIVKINGQVNTYTAILKYPITEASDPNYFEKVFSSVSKSRKIYFSYGDLSAANYIYKNEAAMITKVNSQFELDGAVISYTVRAISQAGLGLSGVYSFPEQYEKPSKVIKDILQNPFYGLQELFTGMKNMDLVDLYNLIPGTDVPVSLERQDNMSPLEYLQYLVNNMNSDVGNTGDKKHKLYVLTYVDDESGIFQGSYFKIIEVDNAISHPEAYQLDVGYPGSNFVYGLNIDNDMNYSIYYDYQKELHPQEYVSRLNADGEYQEIYAPLLSSGTADHETHDTQKAWWTKVTQYPIKASLKIKGLLRPAVLMSYVRVNIFLYGKKHINSGLYIITKQVDQIDGAGGYSTTLDMVRIAGDSE